MLCLDCAESELQQMVPVRHWRCGSIVGTAGDYLRGWLLGDTALIAGHRIEYGRNCACDHNQDDDSHQNIASINAFCRIARRAAGHIAKM